MAVQVRGPAGVRRHPAEAARDREPAVEATAGRSAPGSSGPEGTSVKKLGRPATRRQAVFLHAVNVLLNTYKYLCSQLDWVDRVNIALFKKFDEKYDG